MRLTVKRKAQGLYIAAVVTLSILVVVLILLSTQTANDLNNDNLMLSAVPTKETSTKNTDHNNIDPISENKLDEILKDENLTVLQRQNLLVFSIKPKHLRKINTDRKRAIKLGATY